MTIEIITFRTQYGYRIIALSNGKLSEAITSSPGQVVKLRNRLLARLSCGSNVVSASPIPILTN